MRKIHPPGSVVIEETPVSRDNLRDRFAVALAPAVWESYHEAVIANESLGEFSTAVWGLADALSKTRPTTKV